MISQGPIWLVGLMGAGKSSVGPRLARTLGLPFRDSDAEIVGRDGRSIAEIFARDGEAHFRRLEAEVIGELAETTAVVALGGGAVANLAALERLEARGTVVYLRARPETLLQRIGDPAKRPLLAGLGAAERLDRLRKLLEEREPGYAAAEIVIDTDGRRVGRVVETLARALEARGGRRSEE